MTDRIIPPGHTEDQLMVDTARALALWLHRDQVDKQGAPYFAHLSRVAQRVKGWGGTPEQVAAAWLHDAMEDTTATDEAIGTTIGQEVAHIVFHLTRWSPRETCGSYIGRLTTIVNARAALLVKLADLEDNLSRLGGLSAEDQARLGPRYRAARAKILDALGDEAPALPEREAAS